LNKYGQRYDEHALEGRKGKSGDKEE
jgi:hypothetical protein